MVFVAAPLLSCVQLFGTPWTSACQAFLSFNKCPRAHLNSCTLSWWCNPTILSSVVPFSSCFQPFPASGSFPMGQFFTSGGQSIGASASASVLPMTIKDWFPLRMDSLDLLAVQGTLKSLLQHHSSKSIDFLVRSLLYGPTLTSMGSQRVGHGWETFTHSLTHIHTWLLEKP